MIKLSVLSIVILLVTLGCQEVPPHPGEIVYQTYCAGCHGSQMQGGTATALIKTDWTYGRERQSIERNIQFGIVNTEMVAWRTVLSREEMDNIVDYVIESQSTPAKADRPIPSQIESEDYILKVEKLAKGISKPWGIEFVDANTALISEGTGSMRWLINDTLDPEPITDLPETYSTSRSSGYFDIALDPDYAENGWVYLAFSFTEDSIKTNDAMGMTKVVRGHINDHQWTDEQALFEAPDSLRVTNGNRWGSRFLFDNEGYLYFSIGDMRHDDHPQDLSKAAGKIYRINPDGTIPEDNPFINIPGAIPGIYALGSRNMQGIAQNPETGTIWMTEHGPMGGDELNILKKGANYGWPLITYGIDYSGDTVSTLTYMEGMEQPITYWTPSIAVCPIEFCTSPLLPKWRNNLFVGSLAYEELRRLIIDDQSVIRQEMILKGIGRVRDIKTGPEGALYVLLNEPDMVLRLTPE